MAIDSIPARLFAQGEKLGELDAYYVREGGRWIPTSWKTFAAEVRQAARALIALGIETGGKVAILGFNRPEWSIFDLACMTVGGAPAGIYTTCSPSEVQYIIHHSESTVVLLENEGQWAKVHQERDKLPNLKHVVMMKGTKIDDPLAMTWEEFLAKGDDVDDTQVDERMETLKEEQLATFIYTSGTTGPPKGVMLSHKNLTFTADGACQISHASNEDASLSYLPLSHIAEQVFSLHGPISTGYRVYYAESIAKVPDNLKEVQPTIFFGVPRIWEKFHSKIFERLKGVKGLKKGLVNWAMSVGQRVCAERNAGREPSGLLGMQYKVAKKLIFDKLKPAMGLGKARFCVTGAAPISKEILEFFCGLDLVILEVYGQSEDCGPTSFNRPGNTRFGTVGTAFPGVEIKIAEDKEILVRGDNVFLGYYKDENATADTLVDGWLHSGDLGSIDGDGFLRITGRKKEIIITAGGKNIAPKNIEAALKNHELISEAVVIGDRRKYLTTLLTLDPELQESRERDEGLTAGTLHQNEVFLKEIQHYIDAKVNPLFARVEQVKKFRILKEPLSMEAGELTPTLKVKRKNVAVRHAETIESMYTES